MRRLSSFLFVAVLLCAGLMVVPAATASHQFTSITPPSGSTNGGFHATIAGTGFVAPLAVTFGTTAATIVTDMSGCTTLLPCTSMEVIVPTRATSGAVSITIRSGSDGHEHTAASAFTYNDAPAPTITTVSPNSGSTNGGTTMTLTGTGFATNVDDNPAFLPKVNIGGIAAKVHTSTECPLPTPCADPSATQLKVTVPAHASGEVDIVLENPDGEDVTRADGFTFVAAAAPSISSVTPTGGSGNGNDPATVTIEGNNFAVGAAVTFGGARATGVTVTNDETITVTGVPPHAAGTVSVVVQNPDGQSATEANAFIYTTGTAPALTNPASPFRVPTSGGSLVCLTGTANTLFAPLSVVVGGVAATSIGIGGSLDPDCAVGSVLSFHAPLHGAGIVDVVVTNPNGRTDTVTNAIQYVDLLFAASVSPRTGSCMGGVSTTITGLGFATTGTMVWFDLDGDGAFDNEDRDNDGHLTDEDLDNDGIRDPNEPDADGDNVLDNEVPLSIGNPTMDDEDARSTSATATSLTVTTPPADCSPPQTDVDIFVVNGDGRVTALFGAFDFTDVPAPTFAAAGWITPTSGNTNGGQSATITGTNFATGTGALRPRVFVDDIEAKVTSSTATTISFTVPTHPEVGGSTDVDLVVINPGGDSATKADGFTYTTSTDPATTQTGVTPTSSGTNGGATATLTGNNFATGADVNGAVLPTVTVGGVVAKVNSASAGSISFVVPPQATTGAKDVIVSNPNGDDTPPTGGPLPPAAHPTITYTAAAAPTVSEVTQTSVTTLGGQTVNIAGTNFATGANKPIVTFGGIPGTDVVVGSAESLSVKAPARSAVTNAPVVVTNPDGKSCNPSDCDDTLTFTLGAAPLPTTVSVLYGPVDDMDVFVVVTGSNFGTTLPADGLQFGGTNAQNVVVVSPSEIRATLPPHAGDGLFSVIVKNHDGQSGSVPNFRFVPDTPIVGSVTPSTGTSNGGTAVEILGSGFATNTAVFFGGRQVGGTDGGDVLFQGAGEIDVLTPGRSAGVVEVALVDQHGQTGALARSFTYVNDPAPTVRTAFPASGPALGGSMVTLRGTGFAAGIRVAVGGIAVPPADVVFVDATEISFVTPSHAAGSEDILVTNRDGDTGSLADGFTFLGAGGAAPPSAPSITGISPNQGLPAGGTVVTITGTNFASGATVTFGGTAATSVSVTGSTTITATTPPHDAGPVNVVVTVGSLSDTETNGFTYTNTPTTTPGPGPGPTTTTNPTTTTDPTTTSTTAPTSLTDSAIENANKRIVVTVTRDGDDNVIGWELPASRPATVMGVQIWRSNSPYTLVQDIPVSDPDFAAGEFRDTSSAAEATSKYLVTMYYGLTAALGQFTNANAPDTEDYPGIASTDPQPGGDGGDGGDGDGGDTLPTWAIVLIALGILFLVVLVAVLIARGRNRDGQQQAAATQGYAWQEEGEAQAAEGEWQPPAEVHQARCPACATSFTATGQKPIVTVCPGCGKKGILR